MSGTLAADYNRPQPMSYAEQQRLKHAEYVARVQRRQMPPRCHPFAILIMVLSVGMMFIGVTMTIIAHWPGATQIGENPLKVAGPVLLGVGFIMTLFSIFLIYILNQRERDRWNQNLHNLVTAKVWVMASCFIMMIVAMMMMMMMIIVMVISLVLGYWSPFFTGLGLANK